MDVNYQHLAGLQFFCQSVFQDVCFETGGEKENVYEQEKKFMNYDSKQLKRI